MGAEVSSYQYRHDGVITSDLPPSSPCQDVECMGTEVSTSFDTGTPPRGRSSDSVPYNPSPYTRQEEEYSVRRHSVASHNLSP
jgi:hypothetical protein